MALAEEPEVGQVPAEAQVAAVAKTKQMPLTKVVQRRDKNRRQPPLAVERREAKNSDISDESTTSKCHRNYNLRIII